MHCSTPHVGGQFNIKHGAFTEYVVEKALEAGADAIAASHSHIPQNIEWKGSVPCAYCLGNFNMNPRSYLALSEMLTNYGCALHFVHRRKAHRKSDVFYDEKTCKPKRTDILISDR
jgi:hypothetical protein